MPKPRIRPLETLAVMLDEGYECFELTESIFLFRDVKSLMGSGFYETPSDGGLLALAQSYRNSHYKASPASRRSSQISPGEQRKSLGDINPALDTVQEDKL